MIAGDYLAIGAGVFWTAVAAYLFLKDAFRDRRKKRTAAVRNS
jgi:hypothetical protein